MIRSTFHRTPLGYRKPGEMVLHGNSLAVFVGTSPAGVCWFCWRRPGEADPRWFDRANRMHRRLAKLKAKKEEA